MGNRYYRRDRPVNEYQRRKAMARRGRKRGGNYKDSATGLSWTGALLAATIIGVPVGMEIGPPLVGCNVKANISYNTGERIYHVPGQEYYWRTRINLFQGEQWFCSEEDARAAGGARQEDDWHSRRSQNSFSAPQPLRSRPPHPLADRAWLPKCRIGDAAVRDDLLPTPDILIAMVAIGSGIHRVEAIEFEGELWLVTDWLEHPEEGWMQPARMVSLKAVRHHRVVANDFQIVVEAPLPADMMFPHKATETAKKTEVREAPPVRFRLRSVH